jgi:hypothetical protein
MGHYKYLSSLLLIALGLFLTFKAVRIEIIDRPQAAPPRPDDRPRDMPPPSGLQEGGAATFAGPVVVRIELSELTNQVATDDRAVPGDSPSAITLVHEASCPHDRPNRFLILGRDGRQYRFAVLPQIDPTTKQVRYFLVLSVCDVVAGRERWLDKTEMLLDSRSKTYRCDLADRVFVYNARLVPAAAERVEVN